MVGLIIFPSVFAQAAPSSPATLPDIPYHLTARPWQPLNTPRDAYLDRIEGVVRYEATLQDADGAIIDPVRKKEWQYATPYFANCIGVLLSAGRAKDLLDKGIAAMEHATQQMAIGNTAIPQQHGNFFLSPMADALPLYEPFVPAKQLATWRSRMKLPVDQLTNTALVHNWRAYAMKGEWDRALQGLVTKDTARNYIETNWIDNQRARFTSNPWNLYHDTLLDPDSFAYEAATRANLWNMLLQGYDGASTGEMKSLIQHGTQSALLMQDATGQCPGSGRSGNHTWNDAYGGLTFGVMAENAKAENDLRLAGQYRHAALLSLKSTERWRNNDGTGQYYFVTKNHFPFTDKVKYANYSGLTNYNGNVMFHFAETWKTWKSDIVEQPVPAEIGGYVLAPDESFGIAVANAGGMQLQVSLHGQSSDPDKSFDQYWTTLGITRFSRVNWDSRLGPSDGVREAASGLGVSFAPTFLEGGEWKNMASLPGRYQASLTVTFTHPLLVRARLDYAPVAGQDGPTFSDNLVITPDGVLSTVTSSAAAGSFGVTWPVLTNDGSLLNTTFTPSASPRIATVRYPKGTDEQNFISLHAGVKTPSLVTNLDTRRSSYGDLLPVRMVSGAPTTQTFIYPRSEGDPAAETVRTSFTHTGDDFATVLGRVKGTLYVGRTSAGGVGTGIDLNGDGVNDVGFSSPCGFILQLDQGRVTAVETDRPVYAVVQDATLRLSAYTPSLIPSAQVH